MTLRSISNDCHGVILEVFLNRYQYRSRLNWRSVEGTWSFAAGQSARSGWLVSFWFQYPGVGTHHRHPPLCQQSQLSSHLGPVELMLQQLGQLVVEQRH